MTTANNHRRRPRSETALVHGDHQQSMQPDQDYRLLERTYRHSAQYAEMVRRYPVLKHTIEDCQQTELVGDQPDLHLTAHHGSELNWHRSHGES